MSALVTGSMMGQPVNPGELAGLGITYTFFGTGGGGSGH